MTNEPKKGIAAILEPIANIFNNSQIIRQGLAIWIILSAYWYKDHEIKLSFSKGLFLRPIEAVQYEIKCEESDK